MRFISILLLAFSLAAAPFPMGLLGPPSAASGALAHHAMPAADFDQDRTHERRCCEVMAGYCQGSFASAEIPSLDRALGSAVRVLCPPAEVLRTASLKVEVPPPRI